MRTVLIRSPRLWLHAVAGALLSLPPALAAVLAAPPGRPLPLRIAASTVALLAVLAAMGFPRPAAPAQYAWQTPSSVPNCPRPPSGRAATIGCGRRRGRCRT
ncbi:hypothetical protein [Streptomyces sp. NPDC052811]|uniref:hypothetical protein n=1 Tax=Streptomyces sp. NPDC052811 TaxID=3155731 RepID=UPI003415A9E2